MAMSRKTEALVAGAGPVGLFSALSLAEQGVRVEVIDEKWRTAGRSYALALHPRTLELLDKLGLARDLVSNGHRLVRVAFYDGKERRAEVNLDATSSSFPFLLVLPQNVLESVLERAIEARKGNVHWSHRLSRLDLETEHAVATVETMSKASVGYAVATTSWVVESESEVEATYVIGTDGHRSDVRRTIGGGFEVKGEPELLAIFEFAAATPDLDEVRIVFTDGKINVLWPLGNGRFRWGFELEGSALEAARPGKSRLTMQVGKHAYPYLTGEDLTKMIAERAPWFEGEIGSLDWSVAVRFERRLAGRFGRGPAWLAGDAAHLSGPVGVHSMNVGMSEAADLTSRIVEILRRGGDAKLLDEYGERARRAWLARFEMEGGAVRAEGADPWVAERAARIASSLPGSGAHLGALAARLGLEVGAAGVAQGPTR